MVQDNDLSGEVLDSCGRLVLGVRGDVSSLISIRHILDVKSTVVSGGDLRERFVMHLHGLDLCAQLVGGESDDHAGLDNSDLTQHGPVELFQCLQFCKHPNNKYNVKYREVMNMGNKKFMIIISKS